MKIFIGCSSSDDIEEKYKTSCKKYLKEILKENDLVFGADKKGLMGLAYDIAKENKRKIIGICPERYKTDFKKINCDIEIITKTVYGRTNKVAEESDASIFLPGGIGTMYELFSFIESKRSHEFDKPIVIFNKDNYFDELIKLLEKIYKQKFTSKNVSNLYHISNNSSDTLSYLKNYNKNMI